MNDIINFLLIIIILLILQNQKNTEGARGSALATAASFGRTTWGLIRPGKAGQEKRKQFVESARDSGALWLAKSEKVKDVLDESKEVKKRNVELEDELSKSKKSEIKNRLMGFAGAAIPAWIMSKTGGKQDSNITIKLDDKSDKKSEDKSEDKKSEDNPGININLIIFSLGGIILFLLMKPTPPPPPNPIYIPQGTSMQTPHP